jgi:hypothetical protein
MVSAVTLLYCFDTQFSSKHPMIMEYSAFYFQMHQEMLVELAKREKQAGIFPDAEIDAFMKVYTHTR